MILSSSHHISAAALDAINRPENVLLFAYEKARSEVERELATLTDPTVRFSYARVIYTVETEEEE